jgi:hypothetical protein
MLVTAVRWDLIGEKKKDELLTKVQKHFSNNLGDKEAQALGSGEYPVDNLS